MKRKILAFALVISMAVVAIAGASLAYLTDTDEQTNTFTSGKVDITLDEATINAIKDAIASGDINIGDLGDLGHDGLTALLAHASSSLSASAVAAAAVSRSFMKRSLSRAFCRMISAERVSMTPLRLEPRVSVSLR